ncbi:MAG: tRNA (guanosine(46)-N7)-methyltransferase TrmB [Kiritimatiellae bacterium]|nr:tRNA (guanosine(46)-N7)-methyltransferase TrmB [Kiritimatiellia bacterium]
MKAAGSRVIAVTDPTAPLPLDGLLAGGRPLEIEIGCGNGRFLVARAKKQPDTVFLGIERMLSRVRKLDKTACRLGLDNIRILRLDAFYTFYYLLPRHRARAVYVFFPDPWPKRHHHNRRLFSPLFLDALWARLEIGGTVQIATDHREYFDATRKSFTTDTRFREIQAMERDESEQTVFEMLFRRQALPIWQCAFRSLPHEEKPLPPLRVSASDEPREHV